MVRQLAIRLALLPACYLTSALFQLNHVVYTLLKGNYFCYQAVFYTSMFLFSLIVVPPQHPFLRRGLILLLGPLIGYVSGLIAFFLMPLRTATSLEKLFDVRDLSSEFFLSPVFTFAWLVGFYFILLVVFLGMDGGARKTLGNQTF